MECLEGLRKSLEKIHTMNQTLPVVYAVANKLNVYTPWYHAVFNLPELLLQEKSCSRHDAFVFSFPDMERSERLAALKNRRLKAQTDNRNDTREEASKPPKQAKPAEEEQLDERSRNLSYTLADQEAWNEKLEEKASKDQAGFSTYNEMAVRKFTKLSKDIKPNMELYEYNKSVSNVYRDAHSLDYGANDQLSKPAPESIDKMTKDLDEQLTKRGNRSKRRAITGDEDINYINERNRVFNRKVFLFLIHDRLRVHLTSIHLI